MKNLLIVCLFIISIAGCQNPDAAKVAFGEGPHINMMKKMVENYEKGDLDANLTYYSDTAKIYPQGWGLEAISPQEDMKNSKEFLASYSEYDISEEIYEVVSMDGTDYLHLWGVWTGKLKANDKEVKIPFFLNPAVKDGKIQFQSFYSDGTIALNAFREAMEAQKLAEENTGKE